MPAKITPAGGYAYRIDIRPHVTAKIRVLLRQAATRFEGRCESGFDARARRGSAAHSEAQRRGSKTGGL